MKTSVGRVGAVELVPSIDLGAFVAGTPRERNAVARAVDDACRRVGFMQVVGHGVAPAAIAAMRAETDAFFERALEQKLRYAPARPGLNRGYAALGSEALAYSLGVATRRPDLFEAFNIGPDVVPDDDWHRAAPHDYFAPNIWPEDMPAMRAAVMRYFEEAARVALMLTDVFALALGLPERWFRPRVERSTLTLRVLNYERRPDDPAPSDGQMRMGAHTDYGVVTVLFADQAPGCRCSAPRVAGTTSSRARARCWSTWVT